ncbi:MAG: orotidine 5'-phosphate decarboxylase [Ignavibacteria bacterium GWC2_56_12]|nr:MAG: orotidine 5'-phosphate decarboxylase [Ignavibacteria bacterium GWC2_56_12]
MSFTDRLRSIQLQKRSLLCVGLDVDPAKLPQSLKAESDGIIKFITAIIEATSDLVCAYKPNLAFFEAMGSTGWETLYRTMSLMPKDVLSIGDGKRGDIGNTGERYAAALFDDLKFDAVTVSPYMGRDSVEPFLTRPDKGVFLLALTSNPGSKDFQRKRVGKTPLFEFVIRTARTWDTSGALGYVIGATHPRELKKVRSLVPNAPLLIPGVGSQGGDLEAVVRYGCSREGDLAVINASRSILYASSGDDFAKAARMEALRLRDAMEKAKSLVKR